MLACEHGYRSLIIARATRSRVCRWLGGDGRHVSEEHHIVDLARGEPLPAGRVGVRVRFALSGSPSARWSRDLRAHLTMQLAGHPAVGHLRLNDVIQGSEIVLEGVEPAEAPNIAGEVERAVDAANADCADGDDVDQSRRVRQPEAHAVAHEVRASQRRPDPGTPA